MTRNYPEITRSLNRYFSGKESFPDYGCGMVAIQADTRLRREDK